MMNNQKGYVLIVVLVLMLAAVPAAVTLLHNARSDLTSALDDYHYVRATYAAHALADIASTDIELARLAKENWPDCEIALVIDQPTRTITATLARAKVTVAYATD